MTKEESNRLTQNLHNLCNRTTNLTRMLTFMIQLGILKHSQQQDIESNLDNYHQNSAFYNILIKQIKVDASDTIFDKLLDAIQISGNEHLVNLLEQDLNTTVADDPDPAYEESRKFNNSNNIDVDAPGMVTQNDPLDGWQQMKKFNRLHKYKGFVGKGGFGAVFHGLDKSSKVDIALKAIPLRPWSVRPKIMREIEILQKLHLQSPNDERQVHFVKYTNSWILEGAPHNSLEKLESACKNWKHQDWFALHALPLTGIIFIQMEFCSEGNLLLWLRNPEVNHEMQVGRQFFQQIAAGLSFLHSKRIIHRDLKPENILLAKHPLGGRVSAKIGDFGISRVRLPGAQTTLTLGLGSYPYDSPEVNHPQENPDGSIKEYTHKVDIYSLGVILFFIHYPMTQNTDAELNKYYQIFNEFKDGVSFPNEFHQKYDEEYEFVELLSYMLSMDPDERPDADQVVQSWAAILNS